MKAIVLLFVALLAFQSVKAEPTKTSTTCDACEYIVGIVENYINANYTVDEITTFLDGWCSVVPQLGQVCDQIVQWGVQDFINFVDTNEAPQAFCAQVKLCSPAVAQVEGANCALCEYVIQVVETYVESNTTVDEFVGILDHYCSLVPAFAQVCDQLVQYGVQDLLNYIQADLTPTQVCTLAKLCSSEDKVVVPATPAVVSLPADSNCDLCEYVVSFIETYVENNSTVSQIVNALDTMCNDIPGVGPICDQLVQMGIQQIVAYIQQDLSPVQVCTLAKLCSSEKAIVPAVVAPMDSNCALCKYVVTMIESWVESNATVNEVLTELDQYCSTFNVGPICDQLVQYGIEEIINYINTDLTPTQVCTLVKLCTSQEKPQAVPLPAAPLDNCDTCKYVVTIIESWVEDNATVAEIEQDLITFCNTLNIGSLCNQMIQYGLQEIINYINADLTPTQVCTLAKICTSPKSVVPVVPAVMTPKKQTDCDVCEYVITIIEGYLEDNATVAEIEADLQQACNVIPGIGPICQEMIQMGIQQIVTYINANLSPAQICTLAKICTSAPVPAIVKAQDSLGCDICKTVVGQVEAWIQNNSTINEIVNRIETLCTYVPGYESFCDQVVVYGVHEFVVYIVTNEQPETVCAQLTLCSSPKSCPKANLKKL